LPPTREDSEMRVRQIARKDFADAVRTRQLYLLVGLFGLIGLGVGYLLDGDVGEALLFLMIFLAPLIGLSFTQHAIAGKRESHELAVLLSLPFSRRDVVAGSYAGRTGLLVVTLASLYAGAIAASLLTGTPLDPGLLAVGFVLLTVIGCVFVSIALGISAGTRSTTVASIGSFLAYIVFVLQVWGLAPRAVAYLLNGFEFPETEATWEAVFTQLSPFAALRNVLVPVSETLAASFPVIASGVPTDPPAYQQPWFGAIVLLVWLVVPALAGYYRFERSDL
jgi:ABC-2 type transport system permease protein